MSIPWGKWKTSMVTFDFMVKLQPIFPPQKQQNGHSLVFKSILLSLLLNSEVSFSSKKDFYLTLTSSSLDDHRISQRMELNEWEWNSLWKHPLTIRYNGWTPCFLKAHLEQNPALRPHSTHSIWVPLQEGGFPSSSHIYAVSWSSISQAQKKWVKANRKWVHLQDLSCLFTSSSLLLSSAWALGLVTVKGHFSLN